MVTLATAEVQYQALLREERNDHSVFDRSAAASLLGILYCQTQVD